MQHKHKMRLLAALTAAMLLAGCACSASSGSSAPQSSSAAVDSSAPQATPQPVVDDPIDLTAPDDAQTLQAVADRFAPAALDFDLILSGVSIETADIDTLAGALGLEIGQQGQTRYAGQWGTGVSMDQNVEKDRLLSCTLDSAVDPALWPTENLAGIEIGDSALTALEKPGFGPNTAAGIAELEDLEFAPAQEGWQLTRGAPSACTGRATICGSRSIRTTATV